MQALRAKRQQANIDAYGAARNCLMLYDINSDPKKQDEATRPTVSTFMPYPQLWDMQSLPDDFCLPKRVAKLFMARYEDSPAYVKFAVNGIIKDIQTSANS